MSSHLFIIILVQYILLLCIFTVYMLDISNLNPFRHNKLMNSLFVGAIECMMIYIDLHNNFETILPIYTLTLRLLLISLIALHPKDYHFIIVIPLIMITRFFLYENLINNILIFLCIILVILITRMVDQLRISKFHKWYCIIGIFGFIFMLYLKFINTSFNYFFDYGLFITSVIMISFLLNIVRIKKINRNKWLRLKLLNIENYYHFLIHNQKEFKVMLIEIENIKLLKSILKLSEYRHFLSDLGYQIKSIIDDKGEVGEMISNQFCILFEQPYDLNQIGRQLCIEIEKLFSSYKKLIQIKINYKIMDGKEFTYYYNHLYVLSNN